MFFLIKPTRNDFLCEIECSISVSVDQQRFQTGSQNFGNQGAVVTTHRFQTLEVKNVTAFPQSKESSNLAIHFIVFVRLGEVESRIAFLVDQQIWVVDLKIYYFI